MLRRLLGAIALAAIAATPAYAGSWGAATPITGATSTDYRLKSMTAGLAGNGDAVIGYVDKSSFAELWTRHGGQWAKQAPFWSFLDSVVVAMNDRGDIAVAGIGSDSTVPGHKVFLGYKPAGAPWQLPDVDGYTD